MDFEVGQTVGDYEILSVLGAGGMGQVFRVRNVISEREEAMKVVLPDIGGEPEVMDRFLREIKVQASLVHPNIAALHTAVRTGNRILMIMELVEGETLREKLRFGRLPQEDAIWYMDQVLSGLGFAHARGVVHRDVKPANILITGEGHVKLTDFGIARRATERTITGTGKAVGSLYYMSPEQINAGAADGRSDVYAAGATLYEALTGGHPIEGDNEFAIMHGHLSRVPVAPHRLLPEIPDRLSGLVMKALEKRPENRYSSALEFQAALREFQGGARREKTAGRTKTIPVTGHPTDALARLEAHLVQRLGPMAHSVVRDAARRHSTMDEICRAVAEHLPGGPERSSFLRACSTDPSLTPLPGGAPPPIEANTPKPAGAPIDTGTINTARQKLAAYLGPIANLVVDRTARRVTTADELYDALAAMIPEDRERRDFLTSVGRKPAR